MPPRRGTGKSPKKGTAKPAEVDAYRHPEATSPMRPDVGTQAQYKKRKPPKTYRYDSSLAPELAWDGQNAAREAGEALIRQVLEAGSLAEAKAAAERLRALGRPFLNWAGKAERLSFDVPTLPLFIHERLSTLAIIEALRGHRRDRQLTMFDLFGDPEHPIVDQHLRAYEHRDRWVNRLILGDNLAVMNSLLHQENMGGQVQMIYLDPPYGVKYGSNFQPFVRKRDVKDNDDGDMTREPEMVQAFRDTWEVGLHSYLTYLRDRLLVCRELLHRSGSIFVQISDENIHHVREVMDEVYGPENAVAIVVVKKTGGLGSKEIKSVADYLLWYARDKERVKYQPLFEGKELGKGESTGERYDQLLSPDGTNRRPMTPAERGNPELVPPGWRAYQLDNLTSGAFRENTTVPFQFKGEVFHPGQNACWKTTVEGLNRLASLGRIMKAGNTLRYVRFLDDFPCVEITNLWDDVAGAANKLYVIQTSPSALHPDDHRSGRFGP
jgi:adenine-specific DNA-methyltransferase